MPWQRATILGWALFSIAVSAFWYPPLLGGWFDGLRFALWLVVPLALAARVGEGGLGACRLRPAPLRGAALAVFLGTLVLVGVALWIGSSLDDVTATYAFAGRGLASHGWRFLALHLLYTLSWLPGYEFMLRGSVLGQTFPERPTLAAAVTVGLDVLAHVHKPVPEWASLCLFSPILAWLTLRTSTLLWPVVLHLVVELLYPVFLMLAVA